jgi:predicted DsbA family dithiol-disulfide isomerase
MAKRYAMPIQLPSVQPRSSLAFQMSEYARSQDLHYKAHLALFHAFFVEDRNIGDLSVLLDIGANLGLDVAELEHHLTAGTYKAEVDQQRQQGLDRQVTGVPALFLEPVEPGAFSASGAVGGNTDWLEHRLMEVVQ